MKDKTFYILTLGCKINQYESEAIRESWLKQGLREVGDPKDADIVLINSCAVTQMAVSDTKKYARRFARENPDAKIVVTGCAVPRWQEEIASIKGVTDVVPQAEKPALMDYPAGKKHGVSHGDFSLEINDYFRARPLIKVQDGCSHFCTYCIVPLTRGPARSRDVDSILHEIRRILKKGFKEIIISGINLKEFRQMYQGRKIDLWDLIELIAKKEMKNFPDARIRISSLDPSMLNKKALDVLRDTPEVVPHLHISIQSASRNILNKMRRSHYGPEDIAGFIEKLKEIWPVFGLGCDVLVGFPGERERDFEATYDFCKKMPFTYGHVFRYSKRPSTPAAKYKEQVPRDVKSMRSSKLRELFLTKKKEFLKRLLNLERLKVVVEDTEKRVGMSEYYVICKIEGNRPLKKGEVVEASLKSVDFANMSLVVGKDL